MNNQKIDTKTAHQAISFDPIVGKEPKVLILGSMPGIKSLEKSEYYGHPRNAFWQIIADLFNEKIDFNNYDTKKEAIINNHLALWDTLKLCQRVGSLDTNINKEEPNDIETLLKENPTIKTIVFNGKASEKYFKKHLKSLYIKEAYTFISMPSTSPAHTMPYAEKIKAWKRVKHIIK